MAIQYIQDNNGLKTAVVIPIDEWKDITNKHEDLRELEKKTASNKMKPSDFAGTLSNEGYMAINEHIKQARNEWDRDTY